MNLLFDTSVLIEYLRIKDTKQSLFYRISMADTGAGSISLITYAELYAGKSVWTNPTARKSLEDLLAGLDILVPNVEIARKAGELRALSGMALSDCLIGATALAFKLTLVTSNRKDFSKIKELKLYP